MSARAGVSPRCSSSFYGGRRIPRCHNKTLAAASLAGERESYRGREEREGAAHAFAAELISESMSLLLALPPPSLFYLTFAMTSSFPVWRRPLLHTCHPAASTTRTALHPTPHPPSTPWCLQ